MPTRVQMPDGKIAEFPDGMKPEDIQGAIEQHASGIAQMPDGTFNPMHPIDNIKSNLPSLLDVGKGMIGGGLSTYANIAHAVSHIPGLSSLAPQADQITKAATPQSQAQSMGRGVEQASEFLIPGGAEEAAGVHLLPMVGKLASKAIPAAIGAGLVNKAQGGSFVGGAAAGAGGAALAAGIGKMASPLARKAMNIRGTDNALGRDAGQAILDETTGVRPKTIADQATAKLNQYGGELNTNAANSTVPVDLSPARTTASQFLQKADAQSERTGYGEIQQLQDMLHTRPSGATIAPVVPATDALELKRGIGAYKGSWNPTVKHDLADNAVNATYGAMQPGLEAAIPNYTALNSKISSLIPAAQRAGATDLNENLLARSLSRFGAKTGALAAPLAGASAGAASHGLLGGIVGGGLGILAPEILASPTTLMTGARIAASPTLPKLVRPLIGTGAQFTRNGDNQ